MSAQVIPMDSYPKTPRHDWQAQASLEGFVKALGLVKGLEAAKPSEKRMAVENWVTAGTLSEEERKAVAAFYGWERGP
jgi:hypothetical protein